VNIKPLLGLLLLVAVVAGLYLFILGPEEVPDVVLQDEHGEATALSKMFKKNDHLLIVFLLDGCPISQYSTNLVSGMYRKFGDRIAFTGFLFSGWQIAADYRERHGIRFPLYGLRGGDDPFASKGLIDAVGEHRGVHKVISGGMVIVLDRDLRVKHKLARDDLRELPDRLADLVD
jgi:hypothetical protein